MAFEEKLKELEEVVVKLESGKLSLDEAVEIYNKGMKLSLDCKKELESAKLKITVNNPEEKI